MLIKDNSESVQKYLEKMLINAQQLNHIEWGIQSINVQGYDHNGAYGERLASAEQMINASILTGTIRSLIRTYKSLVKTGAPPKLKNVRPHSDGTRTIHTVFPFDFSDKINPNGIAGVTGEVWTIPQQEESKSNRFSWSRRQYAGEG